MKWHTSLLFITQNNTSSKGAQSKYIEIEDELKKTRNKPDRLKHFL
jgi:hypothetical protein